MPNNQFKRNHSSFNRFAQTDVVSYEQVNPRHLDRPHHWVKLVVFNFDTASERRLNVLEICGGGCTPAHCIEKSIKVFRGIEAAGIRKGHLFDDLGARFNLPDNLQFFTKSIIFDGREAYQIRGFA